MNTTETTPSRKRKRYDNATTESFWSSRKRELVHDRQSATHAEAKAAIFDRSEVFYNRERLHSALAAIPLWTWKPNSTNTIPHASCTHSLSTKSRQDQFGTVFYLRNSPTVS